MFTTTANIKASPFIEMNELTINFVFQNKEPKQVWSAVEFPDTGNTGSFLIISPPSSKRNLIQYLRSVKNSYESTRP
jgi:hypothetical protein